MGAEVRAGRAVSAEPMPGGGFTVRLGNGDTVHARQLLVTTGVLDELPDVPGVRERWGRDVIHCPYCHGWEVRDQAVAVLGTGVLAVHQALLVRPVDRRCDAVPAHGARADGLLASLGVHSVEHPMGVGTHVPVGPAGLSDAPGVWVAGNVTDLGAGLVAAAAGGSVSGAAINADLIAEDTARAVAERAASLAVAR